MNYMKARGVPVVVAQNPIDAQVRGRRPKFAIVGCDSIKTVTSAGWSESAGGIARGQPVMLLVLQPGAGAGSTRGWAAAWGPTNKQDLLGNGQALAQAVHHLLEADQKKFGFSVTLPD